MKAEIVASGNIARASSLWVARSARDAGQAQAFVIWQRSFAQTRSDGVDRALRVV